MQETDIKQKRITLKTVHEMLDGMNVEQAEKVHLLFMANYWGDVKTDHSEVARLSDASHAYSALICDVLVTNDKRMRAKVKSVYSFLGVKTEVVSGREYLEQLSRND